MASPSAWWCNLRFVPLAFHHLAIQCADLPACERFYREELGLEVLRRWPRDEGGDRSVWLALGEGFLALERVEKSPAAEEEVAGRVASDAPWRDGTPGLHLVALRIRPEERPVWEARFQARGVGVVHRTRWTLYVLDPEGNRVGLSHHPEDAP
jgi:catechol 2,3-dioxygenase-like lactoylglutathione lyase family enzyme